MTRDMDMEGGAVFSLRFNMFQSRAALGHSSGSPEALWHILLPPTLFF